MKLNKKCSTCDVSKPYEDYYVRKTSKDGFHKQCKSCILSKSRECKLKNKDERLKKYKEYYEKNKERYSLKSKEYREKNKDIIKARKIRYKQENKDKVAAWFKEFQQKNKDVVNARNSKHRALKLNAIPVWADLNKIKDLYRQAKYLSEITGIKHVVDHIIPLNGKYVTGLHVHTNLRVITWEENARKTNKLIEELL